MNPVLYRCGIAALEKISGVAVLSRPLDALARIWGRHARLRTFLRWGNFDGVIDGGANVGEFARIVRSALPAADLICVEPHAGCAATLRAQGFSTVEAALWHEKGRLSLTQPSAETTSCTVVGEKSESSSSPIWEVAAERLDALPIRGNRLLLKLDLQGAELSALAGMGALWERTAAILLEVSFGKDGTYIPLSGLLAEKGFVEYSTTNEIEVGGRVVEADKIWLRSDFIESTG